MSECLVLCLQVTWFLGAWTPVLWAGASSQAQHCSYFISSCAHVLDDTDVCENYQNMALSFPANGVGVCNRLQLASLPWRVRAFKKWKRLRRHRGRADPFGWQMPIIMGDQDPAPGWTLTDRPTAAESSSRSLIPG